MELQELNQQKEFLLAETAEMKQQKEELFSTDEKLEKFAREQYYFHKEDEVVYIIEEAKE